MLIVPKNKNMVYIKSLWATYHLHFSMLLFLALLTLKNFDTMLYTCFNNNPIFSSRNFYFRHNALIHGLNFFSSMSESLGISLVLEWKNLRSFFFLYSKTNVVSTLNFFNTLDNSFNLFLIIGLVLINFNSDLI